MLQPLRHECRATMLSIDQSGFEKYLVQIAIDTIVITQSFEPGRRRRRAYINTPLKRSSLALIFNDTQVAHMFTFRSPRPPFPAEGQR